ncbi:MAG TPA: hypothetical protein VIK78_04870 [Ruminiclostridium sp.]
MKYDFEELVVNVKNDEYKLIGSGSSRRVYDLDNGHVLKIAKDIRGISQNKAEHEIYKSRKSNIFAEIVAVSEDNKFLIMSKARKIEKISTVYKYYNVRNYKKLVRLKNLKDDIQSNKLSRGDLVRPSSWGLIDDVPVIIDYGLTQRIFKKYYRNRMLKRRKYKPIKL